MIMIIGIALLGIVGWIATKRTKVEIYALTEYNGDVMVYSFTMFTRALYLGDDKVVYDHLAMLIARDIRMDAWLRGVDFGVIGTKDKDYVFIVRYEDVLSNTKYINA